MGPPVVIVRHPPVEIGLELLQRPIDLLPKRHAIELIQHSLVEPLADPVRLRMPGLGPGMINVLHGEIQFVLMALVGPTVLGPTVGQDSVQGNLVLLKERQDSIVEVRGSDRRLPIIEFCEPDLAIGVDERLLIDAPDALE